MRQPTSDRDQIATVPLRWLRPGAYRWRGRVILLGNAASTRYTFAMFREPDGSTCVIIRRRGLLSWLRRRWAA